MRISKKILAIALSILMAISMMPFTAISAFASENFADEIVTEDGVDYYVGYNPSGTATKVKVEDATYRLKVTSTGKIFYYSTAFSYNSIGNVQEITLLKDASVSKDLTISTTGVLDLNGYSLTVASGKQIILNDNAFDVTSGSTVNGIIYVKGNSTLDVEGTVNGTITGNATVAGENNTININDGAVVNGGDDVAIYHPQAGVLNINSGTVTGATAIYAKQGEINIGGGTITANGAKADFASVSGQGNADGSAVIIDQAGGAYGTVKATITGGTISSVNNKALEAEVSDTSDEAPANADVTVSGGTFTSGGEKEDVSAYLANGVVQDETGAVVTDTAVAKIGDVKYDTLAAAFAAATSGQTITVLKDTTVGTVKVLNKTLTLDMGGNTVTTTVSNGLAMHIQYSNFTFKNGTFDGPIAVYGYQDYNYIWTTTVAADATIKSNAAPYAISFLGVKKDNVLSNDGVIVDIYGTVIGTSGAIYSNGTLQDAEGNVNKVNIYDGAVVKATGTTNAAGIYAAGYVDWNITGGTVEGPTGIYLKSGKLNVTGNATIKGTGEAKAYDSNGNGFNSVGEAVTIDNDSRYASVDEVNLAAGTYTSENAAAVGSYVNVDTQTVIDDVIPADSTAVFSSDVTELAAEGYKTTYDAAQGGYVIAVDTTVAKIGDNEYETLEAAFAAAQDGDTITVVKDCAGNGIKVAAGKFNTNGLTVDFGGHTYTVNGTTVGSTGTETQGFQLLKDNKITFKNGAVTGSSRDTSTLQFIIQNYSDLTLDNMELSLEGAYYNQYTLSNNNGEIVIKDSTINAADYSWAGLSAADVNSYAFDVCRYSSYPSVSVTVTGNSVINGNVEVTASNNDAKNGFTLDLASGTLNGDVVVSESAEKAIAATPEKAEVTKNNSFTQEAPEGFEWKDNGNGTSTLGVIADGFNLTVTDNVHMNMYVNVDAYVADAANATVTVTYNNPADQSKTATTDTYTGAELAALKDAADGRYKVTILAAPAQITDDVTVTVKDGANEVHTFTTSVKAYCDAIVAESSDAELVALAKAMLDYGKAANAEFGYADAANFDNYNNTADVTTALNDAATISVSGASGVFTGYAYIATSVPALRIYVSNTEENCILNEKMATVDGVQVAPTVVEGTDKVCIDITGILAEDLDKVHTVVFDGATLQINALQYAKVKGGDFGRSMYNYFAAANAYFK